MIFNGAKPRHIGVEEYDKLLLLDRTNGLEAADVLYSFALEELLCRHVGEGGAPIVHLWRHPRAFVIGLRDSRLPKAAEAMHWLESQGFSAAVRHSGGAAVPLDLGVVNVSLILPKRKSGEMDFRNDFERMYALIREALRETGCEVHKGEIQGAYCPGDFDLSIGGRKFCGIAQRRQAHAFIIQAFVVASGSGAEKAGWVRRFYELASGGAEDVEYPMVTTESMASLDELIGLGSDAASRFTEAVKRVVRERRTSEGMRQSSENLWLPSEKQVIEMIGSLHARYGIGE